MKILDTTFVRSQFPAFSEASLDGWAFFENAGGSYVCRQVIERLQSYYTRTKVQPYYPYPASEAAGAAMDESYERMAGYLNVGVGGMAAKLKQRGYDIRSHWQHLVDRLLRQGLIAEAPEPPSGYSYFLRARSDLGRCGNAFVAGDAAGLATRDMCEGIGPAVRTGLRAARAISGGDPYDMADVAPFTSGNLLVKKGLEAMIAGRRH